MRIRNFSSGVLAAALAAGAAVGLPATVSAAPAATADDIVINEVLSKSDVDEDWVELANLNNEQDLDISGWKIADGGADNVPYEFPADTVIESGGLGRRVRRRCRGHRHRPLRAVRRRGCRQRAPVVRLPVPGCHGTGL